MRWLIEDRDAGLEGQFPIIRSMVVSESGAEKLMFSERTIVE